MVRSEIRRGVVLLGLLTFLLTGDVFGGKLRDFAEEATGSSSAKPEKKKEQSRNYNDAATSSFGSGTYPSDDGGASFLGGFYAWLIASPFDSRHDDPSASLGEDGQGRHSIFPEHLLGEATVPYVRVDYNWQSVDSDIDANDMRVELGYKMLAFHGRSTMYKDRSDGFEMDINQYYGVIRYGGYRPDFLPGTFEAGIGVGVSQIKTNDSGIEDASGMALTFPLKYYPVQWFGVEFRPAWYTWLQEERVGDYDLSASFGHRYLQVRGGYRWLTAGDVKIDGPYAGISLSF